MFSYFHSISFAEVGERSLADLRRDTYARLIRLPMAFYAQRRVGELTSRISADLSQIDSALVGTIPAGAWPREVVALPDDRTVLVTNVNSRSLQSVVVS